MKATQKTLRLLSKKLGTIAGGQYKVEEEDDNKNEDDNKGEGKQLPAKRRCGRVE